MASPTARYFMPTSMSASRTSMTSRISRLFTRAHGNGGDANIQEDQAKDLHVNTTLPSTRYEGFQAGACLSPTPRTVRSHASVRSVIDADASDSERVPPMHVPASSIYSDYYGAAASYHHDHDHDPSPVAAFPDVTSSSGAASKKPPRRRKRRVPPIGQRIEAKCQISVAFGVTLFISLIVYLVLAATGTATGIMFHVLSILLVLGLTGVFCHHFVSMLMLRRQRRHKTRQPRHRQSWWGAREQHGSISDHKDSSSVDGYMSPEKPFPVYYADDHVDDEEAAVGVGHAPDNLQAPPPTYGNFRNSKRIDPGHLHWQRVAVPPTPLTPSYEEALYAKGPIGYQPPSYKSPQQTARARTSPIRHEDSVLHPLERDRVAELTATTLRNCIPIQQIKARAKERKERRVQDESRGRSRHRR